MWKITVLAKFLIAKILLTSVVLCRFCSSLELNHSKLLSSVYREPCASIRRFRHTEKFVVSGFKKGKKGSFCFWHLGYSVFGFLSWKGTFLHMGSC